MIVDQHLERTIAKRLREEARARKAAHQKSGKLSASRLFWPVQWQVLNALGVEPPEFDDYTLRKFRRGEHVEEYVVSQMDGLIEAQKEVEYQGVVGFVDAIVDSSAWEYKHGVIPHEVKSVANSKFKRLEKQLGPDESHCLQATLYALALGTDCSVIDYVASDDYRISSYVIKVSDYQERVHEIIAEYNAALNLWHQKKVLPELEFRASWQANPKYATYPDTIGVKADEIAKQLIEEGL